MADLAKLPQAEFTKSIRNLCDAFLGMSAKHPRLLTGVYSCEHSELKVDTTHDGDHAVPVLVHTPKLLKDNQSNAAIIYAHGGGVVGGSANLYKNYLSSLAHDCNVVVFNVDYRLAPETKCPNNVLDFYYVLKYVVEHAAELGVDPARIAIGGESGGGYICFGTMVLLARNEESHWVKLAIPHIPMVSDYAFTMDTASMTREESVQAPTQKIFWNCIANDMDSQKTDPLLFPDKASDEILSKMPPTIVWEAEFDMFITEASRIAARLRAAGRLLEFVIIPGIKHASAFNPAFNCFNLEREAYCQAIEEYLLK
eukprot:TRINITY_DN29421_c0_g1_i1.p1 TRINITY_DN29421_c0_g1~~TRINITY_DN29421_c0_g1_i1.p1  ORF type:complete len:312 (+),score=78.00 TRINITY_DN29421_c0_g1_i1:1-936(+)